MADQNIWDPNPPPPAEEPQPGGNNKAMKRMRIVGINLFILLVYTLISAATRGNAAIIDAIFIAIQVVTCLILAIALFDWIWVLSAFVVLLIGLSTCTQFFFKLL